MPRFRSNSSTADHTAPWAGIVPPFIVEQLWRSGDTEIQAVALENETLSRLCRVGRADTITAIARAHPPHPMAGLLAIAEPRPLDRRIHDAENRSVNFLPGRLARAEGDVEIGDLAVDEAYDYSGIVYDFFRERFERQSLDDQGMSLVSSVHVGRRFANAFWNGQQMVYGDGDGRVFLRFTGSLDVVAHEMTHGVIQFTSNLVYRGESGALNESFADVFGVLVKQWHLGQTVDEADWLVGAELLTEAPTRRALRSLAAPGTAYQNDPFLGSDPQPAHVRDQYFGSADEGGVHINSGIPNHAFYLTATELGGHAYEAAAEIWYRTMLELRSRSTFAECAATCAAVATRLYGAGSPEQLAVRRAWTAVGVSVSERSLA